MFFLNWAAHISSLSILWAPEVWGLCLILFFSIFYFFPLLIFSANQWIGADTVLILQMKKFKLSRQSASKCNTLYQVCLALNFWIFTASSAENVLSLYIHLVAASYPAGHNSKDTSSEVKHVDLDQSAKAMPSFSFQVVVQSFSHIRLFATPWTAAHHASPSFTISWSLLKLMFIELVMPSNHLVLCRPLLLLQFPGLIHMRYHLIHLGVCLPSRESNLYLEEDSISFVALTRMPRSG